MPCLRIAACLAPIMAVLSGGLAWSQGYSLDEAAQRMTTADGFHVELVAGEPQVRQPILVKFDDRGRLWVIQYLQYPNPAGLKRVKVDRYSRTVYDRIPLPPPQGPRGADRITILEDSDGDGRADKFTDFIDGLNLTTGLAFGHGGVFVIQVPYLLFYPDRDRNDVPDGDPQVLLKGFGMEDSQAFANHLTWGPDGWLYGLNGSTTTCKIRGIEFQQGVWRYHPVSQEFELFCEGGGNVYGLTFDAAGNLFYSSNGTRPSWHGVQGAYYHKAFGKHGELHNPYAFGYFQYVEHENYRGGHVTCGGNFYYGDTFPAAFRGTYIATNLLAHEVHWHTFGPRGSTFRSKREGELLLSNDTWFAPTDLTVGPDGAVYVCDFHDRRTAHPDPDADWDLKNGRVYRIQADGAQPTAHVDLHALSSDRLVDWLDQSNMWYVRLARRILAERRDPSVVPRLRQTALESDNEQIDEQHNVEIAVLNTIAKFDDERVPAKILQEYSRFSDKLKAICLRVLLSRPHWALEFLHQVKEGEIDPETIDIEQLRGLAVHQIQEIDELVRDHWGKITRGTPEEKLADIRRFNNDLRAFPGRARTGHPLYTEHCAKCHKLFGEGEEIGPDLTTANRKDQAYMLVSTVDPSSFIRVEYLSVQIVTEDGRILSGLVTDETPGNVTLVNSKAEETTVARSNIDEIVPSEISQMPEDLLTPLTPQQLRDLMAFLRSDPPAASENTK